MRSIFRSFPSRTTLVLAAAVALPLAGLTSGCTTNKQHRALAAERDFYRQQAQANENVATSARAEAQVYRSQLQASARENRAKDEAIADLTNEMVRMQAEYDQLNASYTEATTTPKHALPQELNDKLAAYARANNSMLEYDPDIGIVKFKSDVTFAPGSAELTKEARAAVQSLARILSEAGTRDFDLMVAGHTDSQPVSRQSTIARGHRDNWYLSSHRAIAVGEALQKSGVSQQRMAVVGYADQRPVASNATATGRAQNRRVEVLILPSSGQFRGLPQGQFVEISDNKSGERSWNAFNWITGSKGDSPSATSDDRPAFNK